MDFGATRSKLEQGHLHAAEKRAKVCEIQQKAAEG
ncbi:hypothetical protein F442_00019 [Phytophthora nicotianae P10297]|uniref:Uncharacterized protein n=2 Tax=Phytophthora nicotianae TaxID=4792 RepID=W3A8C8_PHYNI|nr:hypothetical protein F444_00020 [Phytophthora nicotianae P1976]ETP55431.1 hypothetical protein F442_00019 [Phytophthora nicotianae P10297]